MTPDRREELRRCDDACYRTRTSREMDELKERIKSLESLIHVHNEMCVIMCNDKKDCGFAPYDRDCGRCHKDYLIDEILPKTEEVKYIPKTKISPEYE